jgi:hypothetical protein
MFALPLLISSVFLSLVASQLNDSALQIEAIQAHFNQAGIVPSLLPSFDPSALLAANFAGVGDITPGQPLTKEQSAPTPTISIYPANSSVALTGQFTIAMVDADVVGSDPSTGVNHHWLVNGVEITGNALTNTSATAITAYAGPGPAAGSGPHRYVIILYTQPSSFSPPADLSTPTGVSLFDLNAYVKDSGLGPIVAASYFTVEEGTTTVSVPETSSVISSTLAAVSGTSTAAGTASSTTASGNPANTGITGSNGSFRLGSYSPLSLLTFAFMTIIVL